MQASSSDFVQQRQSRPDIYTVLLAIALVAVIIGCVFLYLEVSDYGSPPYPEGGVSYLLTPTGDSSVSSFC